MRWTQTVADLTVAVDNCIGDILISAGFISYLGPFTAEFRTEIGDSWRERLIEFKIQHTPRMRHHADASRTGQAAHLADVRPADGSSEHAKRHHARPSSAMVFILSTPRARRISTHEETWRTIDGAVKWV